MSHNIAMWHMCVCVCVRVFHYIHIYRHINAYVKYSFIWTYPWPFPQCNVPGQSVVYEYLLTTERVVVVWGDGVSMPFYCFATTSEQSYEKWNFFFCYYFETFIRSHNRNCNNNKNNIWKIKTKVRHIYILVSVGGWVGRGENEPSLERMTVVLITEKSECLLKNNISWRVRNCNSECA